MKQLQLNELAQQIDESFGEDLPVTALSLDKVECDVLGRLSQNSAYQAYLQDQLNRRIIRDYLLNAVMLGFLSNTGFRVLIRQAVTREGRSSLSLHMLMMSVAQASEILSKLDPAGLIALQTEPGSPPRLVVVAP